MKAEILTTGTELLLGDITDTHTAFLAAQLARLGIDLYYSSVVGDNFDRLLALLRQAWQRSDMVIMTGGLGPTKGDLTREVIAALLGEKPRVDDSLKKDLTDYFARVGTEMTENNLKQATLIPSAQPLHNRRGTAPGWWVERDGRIIIALPGPPAELQAMWQNEVLPKLEPRTGAVILSRTLKTIGLSESKVDELVSPLLGGANPTLAMYAKADGIHLRITAKAPHQAAAQLMISEREAAVRGILKDSVWGADSDTLEGVVGQLLKEKGLTLAVAESFTGGQLASTLAAAGSRDNFKGAIIVSGADARGLLGIKPAAKASPETAAGMARWVRDRFAADIGLGLDGDVGSDAEAGTGKAFIAIDFAGKTLSQSCNARTHQIARRATHQAMFWLRAATLPLPQQTNGSESL